MNYNFYDGYKIVLSGQVTSNLSSKYKKKKRKKRTIEKQNLNLDKQTKTKEHKNSIKETDRHTDRKLRFKAKRASLIDNKKENLDHNRTKTF